MSTSDAILVRLNAMKKKLALAQAKSPYIQGPTQYNIAPKTTPVKDSQCQKILTEVERLQSDFLKQIVERSKGTDKPFFEKLLSQLMSVADYLRKIDALHGRAANSNKRLCVAQQASSEVLYNKVQALWKIFKNEAEKRAAGSDGRLFDNFATRLELIGNQIKKLEYFKKVASVKVAQTESTIDEIQKALRELEGDPLENDVERQTPEQNAMRVITQDELLGAIPMSADESEDDKLVQQFLAEIASEEASPATTVASLRKEAEMPVENGKPPFRLINRATDLDISRQMNILRHQDPEYQKDGEEESEKVEEFVYDLHHLHNKGGETYKTLWDARQYAELFCENYPIFKLDMFYIVDAVGQEFPVDIIQGKQQTIPFG